MLRARGPETGLEEIERERPSVALNVSQADFWTMSSRVHVRTYLTLPSSAETAEFAVEEPCKVGPRLLWVRWIVK